MERGEEEEERSRGGQETEGQGALCKDCWPLKEDEEVTPNTQSGKEKGVMDTAPGGQTRACETHPGIGAALPLQGHNNDRSHDDSCLIGGVNTRAK